MANAIVVSPTITTTYSVAGSNNSECVHNISITQSVSACTDINENLRLVSGISIVPNPNNGIFKLKSNDVFYRGTFRIFNTTGQLVVSVEIKNTDETIDISLLSSGLYFGVLKSLNDESSPIVKIVKE